MNILGIETSCDETAAAIVTESGEEIVEGVPMPLEVQGWIEDFIEKHHVDQPFKKQKVRKAYDPRKGGFARNPSVRGNGEGRG